MKKIISIGFFTLLLTGCAGVNSSFSCDVTASSGCMTVEDANQLGNSSKTVKLANNGLKPLADAVVSNGGLIVEGQSNEVEQPKRTKEIVHKIWVAPYVDSSDNYHKEQVIYFTSKNPQWKGFE